MAPQGESLYSVHLSTARTWRGGENQVWLLAGGLQKRGRKVLVLAPAGAPLLERCNASGIPAQPLSFCCEIDPFAIARLRSVLCREKPRILHLHDGHGLMPGQVAASLAGQRQLSVVAHRRTVFPVKGRWKYGRRVDRIIAISAAVRDRLLQAGVSAAKIAVVHSGLEFGHAALDSVTGGDGKEHDSAAALRRTLGVAGDVLLIGHAAALTAEKRHEDMIAALVRANEILKGHGHAGVHLVIAGTGENEAALRQKASASGSGNQIHFLGFVQDLRPLWSASCAAFFASEAEGLGTALVEAQGAGLPAVITRAGGMVEVVADGETGLVVGVRDVDGMAGALVRLTEDTGLRQRLGAAGARRAREKFSCDAMVEGVLGVYRELAGGK